MWKDYFSFNKRQRNGIIVLLVLIFGMIAYLLIADYLPPASVKADYAKFKAEVDKAKAIQADTTVETKPVISLAGAIEMNSSDSASLMALPLMTPKVARTIIHFRDALGGYYSVEQLQEVYGMDSAQYNAIKGKITVDAGKIDKMDLNTVTEKELTRHPYIRKKLAKAIYNYRKANGPFKSVKELMKVDGIDELKYEKLEPYFIIAN